jgi:hypothetical protein
MGWALTPAVDVRAFSYDEAANKVAGDDVIERGSIHKLAAKVWDLNGRSWLYYRRWRSIFNQACNVGFAAGGVGNGCNSAIVALCAYHCRVRGTLRICLQR